jgi:hypothetical protein
MFRGNQLSLCSTVKMEAACFFEALIPFYETTCSTSHRPWSSCSPPWEPQIILALSKHFSFLGMATTSVITRISCAMSSQSLTVCLEGYVHFQAHQTRYVCTKIRWCGGTDDNWQVFATWHMKCVWWCASSIPAVSVLVWLFSRNKKCIVKIAGVINIYSLAILPYLHFNIFIWLFNVIVQFCIIQPEVPGHFRF